MNRFFKFQILMIALISSSTFAQYSYNPEHLIDKALTQYKTLEEVIKIINSYPNEFDIKNSLGIIYDNKAVYRNEWKEPTILDNVGHTEWGVLEGYKEVKSKYKNIGNKPIIVKGLSFNYYPSTNTLTYVNLSFRLEPGETEYYPIIGTINTKFIPEITEKQSQFWGNVGTIKEINKKENEENEKKETIISNTFANRIGNNVIQVNSVLNKTDIKVKKGDKINLNASGRVTLGMWAGSGGPDGVADYTDYNIVPNFKHGSLLVRLSDNDKWTPVGTSSSFVAQGNGILQFIVNDRDPSNNSGSFIIEYGINKTITATPIKPTATTPTKQPVTTPTRTQSNEQTYTQPVTEPAKTTEPSFTDEQLQKALKKVEYVNAKEKQLKSDLQLTNKLIIMNELLLSKYEGKRKTKEYWKYFDENKKLLAEKEEIERKHKEDKILREKEFENSYSSTNLKTKESLNNSTNSTTSSSEITSTFIKSYNGTITNKTIYSTTKCQMTFSKNSDGTFQLKGETDKVNLVGKWNLKGKLIENNIYLFKGDIILGYEGTDFPLGTSAPFTVTVTINDKSMIGNYSIQSNDKSIGTQSGIFTLR